MSCMCHFAKISVVFELCLGICVFCGYGYQRSNDRGTISVNDNTSFSRYLHSKCSVVCELGIGRTTSNRFYRKKFKLNLNEAVSSEK